MEKLLNFLCQLFDTGLKNWAVIIVVLLLINIPFSRYVKMEWILSYVILLFIAGGSIPVITLSVLFIKEIAKEIKTFFKTIYK